MCLPADTFAIVGVALGCGAPSIITLAPEWEAAFSDSLVGTGDDKQYGGPGNDTIYASLGRDESWGEDGDDTLWALARKDVTSANDTEGDVLHGGNGNDRFKTRDGEQDVIDCGPGVDTALLDAQDVIADATPQNPNGSCEVVNRAAPKPDQDRSEVTTPPEQ